MDTNANRITVQFRVERGEAKGRIVKDPQNRRKIVFVDRNFRGRRPKDGETVEVEVTRDTQPSELGKGALMVRPIYAPDPSALSHEDAEARMLEMVRAEGVVINDRYIDVDLPGWKGQLRGSLPKRREEGPLSADWRYEDEDGNRTMWLRTPGHPYVVMTHAIRVYRHEYEVMDWPLALQQLGEPTKIDTVQQEVVWENGSGYLRAKLYKELAYETPAVFSDIKDDSIGYIGGTITFLDGRWVLEDRLLTHGEAYGSRTGLISTAYFDQEFLKYMPAELRRQLVGLLRPHLHSAEWHKQRHIHCMLSPEVNCSIATRQVAECKQAFEDPFSTIWLCQRKLQELKEARAEMSESMKVTPCFESTGDPEIYGTGIADDSAEVARLTAENEKALDRIDATIAQFETKIGELPRLHADPKLVTAVGRNLEALEAEIDTFTRLVELTYPEDVEWVRDQLKYRRGTVERMIAHVASENREDIETVLSNFDDVRRSVKTQIARLTEYFSQRD